MQCSRGLSRLLVLGLAAFVLVAPAETSADSAGLVAAYGFEEASGTTAADTSGSGNPGTLAGPVSSTAGRFGRALSFDGVNDVVNVADSASLDLTTAMTLEAWVKPESTGWRTVLLKERPGGLAYAVYGSTDTSRPSAEVRTSTSAEIRGTAALPTGTWSHVAATYDATTLRLYVNGAEVASRALSGSLAVTTGALRIGGNLVWGEYFKGLIDEVRVYRRVLSAGEIQADMNAPVVPSDTQPPSAPGGLTATATNSDVHLSWTPSTDNVGVTLYRVYRNGTFIASPAASATSYDDNGRMPGTYDYKVVAFDAVGNASAAAQASVTIVAPPPSGPGTLVATGWGNYVTLVWERSSGFVSYHVYRDGDHIALVNGSELSYRDSELAPGTYHYSVIAVDTSGQSSPASEADATVPPDDQAPTAPPNLAAGVNADDVYLSWWNASDNVGVTAYRVYRSVTAGFIPGADTLLATVPGWMRTFDDYDRPLGTFYYAVVAVDAAGNTSAPSNELKVTVPVEPPGAPVGLTATVINGDVLLAWSPPGTPGVSYYRLYRDGTFVANRAATLPSNYTDANVPVGVHRYQAVAVDTAGNAGPPSNEATVTIGPVPQPTGVTASVTQDDVHIAWTAAPSGSGVTGYRVHRSTTSGFTPSAADRIASIAGTSYDDLDRAPGTYYYKVVAVNGAGDTSLPSGEASATIAAPPQPSGLVAAYGFEETSGTTVADSSGNGNTGTISGAFLQAPGKYGWALNFDGVNDLVTIADSNSLDLSAGMTLEAWVRPTVVSGWRTVLLKSRPGGLAYALYSGTDTARPGGFADIGGEQDARGTAQLAANAWTHLAVTYDGANLRLYVNGALASTRAVSGSILVSSGQLQIGGNTVWAEWFQGAIDEVRVYNRALSAAEIAADRDRPVVP